MANRWRWAALAVAASVALAMVALAVACSDADAQSEREALIGTWQLVIDGDTQDACNMAISAISGGIEGRATCGVSAARFNIGPDCDRVERKSEIYGKLLDASFEARVEVISKYEGAGCGVLGIDSSGEVRFTEASAQARRTGGGSGAFGGTWTIEGYAWECKTRVGNNGACIETARRPSEIACDLTVRDIAAGDFDTTCRKPQGGQCEGKLAFSGTTDDSKVDLALSLSDCDGQNPESATFVATKLSR